MTLYKDNATHADAGPAATRRSTTRTRRRRPASSACAALRPRPPTAAATRERAPTTPAASSSPTDAGWSSPRGRWRTASRASCAAATSTWWPATRCASSSTPGDDEWTVVERLPRRNVLCRSDSRGTRANRSRPTSTSSAWWSHPARPATRSSSIATWPARAMRASRRCSSSTSRTCRPTRATCRSSRPSGARPAGRRGVGPRGHRPRRTWSRCCPGGAACWPGSRGSASRRCSTRWRARPLRATGAAVGGLRRGPAHHGLVGHPAHALGRDRRLARACATTPRRSVAPADVQHGFPEIAGPRRRLPLPGLPAPARAAVRGPGGGRGRRRSTPAATRATGGC